MPSRSKSSSQNEIPGIFRQPFGTVNLLMLHWNESVSMIEKELCADSSQAHWTAEIIATADTSGASLIYIGIGPG
jgi:hypothetical protein